MFSIAPPTSPTGPGYISGLFFSRLYQLVFPGILIQGNTKEYKGVRGNTKEYNGMQGKPKETKQNQ